MTIKVASSVDRHAWDAYVRTYKNANMYHLYCWNDIFREAFGCETCYLVAEADIGITGILPLFAVKKSILGGNYVSSLPGGVCANDEDTAQQLIQAAIEFTRERGARYLKLRDGVRRWNDDRLETQIEYTYVLDELPPDPDLIWRGVRANVRTPVRKARKEGLVAVWSNDNLDGFYHAYATNMRDLGTPLVHKCFFEKAIEQFPNNAQILTAHLANQVIGGMFIFTFNRVLNNPFASSIRSFFKLCPNDLLYWEAIRYACKDGYRAFDMGKSAKGSGNARFKEKFLAKPRELFYQYYLNTAKAVPVTRGGKMYRMASPIWRRLPLWITNSLGPVIRYVMPLG